MVLLKQKSYNCLIFRILILKSAGIKRLGLNTFLRFWQLLKKYLQYNKGKMLIFSDAKSTDAELFTAHARISFSPLHPK